MESQKFQVNQLPPLHSLPPVDSPADNCQNVVKVNFRSKLSSLSHKYNVNENILEAGVDEVARGCFFGPVYAAAVILDPKVPLHEWLNDSKRVTKKRRALVRKWIEETAIAWNVASVTNTRIDEINIRNAAMEAMILAAAGLKIRPELLLIDGDYFRPSDAIKDIPYVTVVNGDAKYASISAASILAKEHHDEYIRNMVIAEPELHEKYDITNNVGYGTAKHREGLRTHGCHPYHRKTFLRNTLPQMFPTTINGLLHDSDDDEVEVQQQS